MGNNPVSSQELSTALDALSLAIEKEARKIKIEKLLATDWTVARVSRKFGLTDTLARKVLKKMVRVGLAYEIRVEGESGSPCKAWRPVVREENV